LSLSSASVVIDRPEVAVQEGALGANVLSFALRVLVKRAGGPLEDLVGEFRVIDGARHRDRSDECGQDEERGVTVGVVVGAGAQLDE
jgi:hypothetical protein